MGNILHSFLIAALIVGPVFYVSFVEASAVHEEQIATTLEARRSVDAVIAETVPVGGGSNFTPLWQRARYVRVVPEEPIDEKVQQNTESNEEDTDAVVRTLKQPTAEPVQESEVADTEPNEAPNDEIEETVAQEEAAAPTDTFSFAETLTRDLLRLTNEARQAEGLQLLVPDSALTVIANAHSEDMVTNSYFAHADEDGCDLTCRLEESEYVASAWAENIAVLHKSDLISTEEVAEHIFESWMESDGHRKNILNGSYTQVGIGFAYDGRSVYVTADYAKP